MNELILKLPLIFFIISFSIFLVNYFKDSRSLVVGFELLVSLIFLGFYLTLLVFKYENIPYVVNIAIFLAIIFIILIFILMISLLIVLFTSGIKLIKREGLRLSHMLSLGLGVSYILYIIIWPIFFDLTKDSIFNSIYYALNSIIFYITFLMTMFVLTLFINLIPKKKNYNYIITLGAGLIKDEPTPLLKARIDKAIKKYNKNKNSKIIMSGGQGADEIVSEALAMKNYAIKKGVAEKDIILEDKSTNTDENIKYSYEIINAIENKNVNILVVTSYYHVLRALIIAKKQGVKCDGSGSMTKFYYALNAIIREFIGYLYIKRKTHIKFILFICFLTLFPMILQIIQK